jgi:uncharacterized protein YcbX
MTPIVTIIVSQLNVYPVKGLKGIAVDSAAVTERGLEHDRRFMVVDPSGQFFTQRAFPRMATVWTEIVGDELRLAAPDCDEVVLPVAPAEGEPLEVEVWSTRCRALAPSPEADRWLSAYLGRPCRLVYMPDSTRRASNPAFAGPGKLVGFADGYAFLVVSEASLAELNGRLARPVPMDRFRANIVVTGTAAFAEDTWGEFMVGGATLRMAKPCGRCQVTTTDQATGEVTGPEPLATLAAYRDSKDFGARFAMNAVTVATGVIRVGDPVVPRC